jgi:hypothetical protein
MAKAPTLWHPGAKRVIIPGVPDLRFGVGGKKLVWHTTEGSSIEGAEGAYRASTSIPHFTIQVVGLRRILHQHLPIDRAATALQHTFGPETNRANAIQVEIVGFAAQSGSWSRATYFWLYWLARWISKHAGVPMSTPVTWRKPVRLSPAGFVQASGHVGHMHVPGNSHTDPGIGFHIGRVTKFPFGSRS